jgi:hypothetical protein
MAYDNTNRGTIGRNDQKQEGSKQPDFRGQCNIDGREFWISGWIQTNREDGSKFFSLAFEDKQEAARRREGQGNGGGRQSAPQGRQPAQRAPQGGGGGGWGGRQQAPAQTGPADQDGFDDDIPF